MAHRFHRGELEVQVRAGVADIARQVANGTRDYVPDIAKVFLENQNTAVLSTVGKQGDVWASLVTDRTGFIRVPTPNTIVIMATPATGDPLFSNLTETGLCGLIAVEFASRRRMRDNGEAKLHDTHIEIKTHEVYSNCPKYIQSRTMIDFPPEYGIPKLTGELNEEQQRWIAEADTFFIASSHSEQGMDISHRGGYPGFVDVQNGRSLLFPDYSGNRMFNTLGNISVNPNAGLLFIDFTTGATLQLSGKAKILWASAKLADFPGAERLVEFQTERVIQTNTVHPVRWEFNGYSPFLPTSRAQSRMNDLKE